MRLWSLHPKYLDPRGLVALWREALLAKAVLRGETRGYARHPQLERFTQHSSPRAGINAYLSSVHAEGLRRGYAFDRSKVGPVRKVQFIPVSTGQLACEWQHLQAKLKTRNPTVLAQWSNVATPACHPLFRRQPGPVASWERAKRGGKPSLHATCYSGNRPLRKAGELQRLADRGPHQPPKEGTPCRSNTSRS